MTPDDFYMFVIDTNSYSGNFEREVCAYITGQVAEVSSSDAEDQAALALQAMPEVVKEFEDLMLDVQDDPDMYPSFVANWPTPGYGSNGRGKEVKLTPENKDEYHYPAHLSVAIFFSERPSDKLIAIMKKRALHLRAIGIPWHSNTRLRVFAIENFRLLHRHVEYTELEIK